MTVKTIYREIEFLQENFDHVFVLDQHCVGYFDGKREELGDILDREISSYKFYYVKKDLHSREKIITDFRSQVGLS